MKPLTSARSSDAPPIGGRAAHALDPGGHIVHIVAQAGDRGIGLILPGDDVEGCVQFVGLHVGIHGQSPFVSV